MRLSVEDATKEIYANHKVILKTNSGEFRVGDVLRIQSDNNVCGATVHVVENGDGKILIDKYLCDNLGIKPGDVTDVEKIDPKYADIVEITVPEEFLMEGVEKNAINITKKRLIGKPIYKGNKEAIVIKKEVRLIQINETVPSGIVIPVDSTKFRSVAVKRAIKAEGLLRDEREDPLITTPTTSFSDIGGLEDVKQELSDNIIDGIKNPEFFRKYGILPSKTILLYGPPGTGKTLLAEAVATESGAKLILTGTETYSKWLGESEERIRSKFSKALENAPSILFFDEIDAIAHVRDGRITDTVVTQMIKAMDYVKDADGVFVIAATNKIDRIDPAIRRRFDYELEVPLPNEKTRKKIFDVHLRNKPLGKDVTIKKLALFTGGCSGSDIETICKKAVRKAMREKGSVKMAHFEEVIKEHTHATGEPASVMYR
uniref:VCP-like ATPase n=1 Tax=Candidatus Methanogaster sp. ANME-2c ERB4 TaxID=2759911 RepID=A0A7G9YEA9_9EURY|nr:VCP-like ATPase [Methanosarcinales archaeon ANME-2c ERB4]